MFHDQHTDYGQKKSIVKAYGLNGAINLDVSVLLKIMEKVEVSSVSPAKNMTRLTFEQ